jgi:hypothetical protein
MPAHSSHLLQPLDVGCFSALKKAYGRKIEDMMRVHINHIQKEDFLPAFHSAFYDSMTPENIQGGFRGAGLVPLDPESVLSKLDVKLKTPTPPNSRPGTSQSWTSRTPHTNNEAFSQSTLIKNKISRHQNSSPTHILEAVNQFAKGTTKIMHEMALMQSEIKQLRKANEELSKRRKARKRRIRQGGSLQVQDAKALQEEIDVNEQLEEEMRGNGGWSRRVETRARRCGNCGETGHNARTCGNDVDMTTEEDSD